VFVIDAIVRVTSQESALKMEVMAVAVATVEDVAATVTVEAVRVVAVEATAGVEITATSVDEAAT